MNKKIVLWGAYGSNYGDNMMLDIILQELDFRHINVILVSKYLDIDSDLFKNYKNVVDYIPFFSYGLLEKFIFLLRHSKGYLHIWGGGTNFTDFDGCGNPIPFLILKMLKSDYGYLAIGIGKITKFYRRKLAYVMLKLASFITVRDAISYSCLENKFKNKLILGSDLVYNYVYNYKLNQNKSSERYILFTTRNLVSYIGIKNNEEYLDYMCELIKKISKKLEINTLKILVTDKDIDYEDGMYLYNNLDSFLNIKIISTVNHQVITDLIFTADYIISTRLHTSLIGEMFGKKILTISYSKKIEIFYKEINKSNYISIDRTTNLNDYFYTIYNMFLKNTLINETSNNLNNFIETKRKENFYHFLFLTEIREEK